MIALRVALVCSVLVLTACGGGEVATGPTPPSSADAGEDADAFDGADAPGSEGATEASPDVASDGAIDGATDAGPPLEGCTVDGWCWENPLPHGNSLTGVWAAAKNDVWVVGNDMVLRFDGAKWSNVPLPSSALAKYRDLRAVWGSGPNDVWAVGTQSSIFRFDGKAWDLASGEGGDPYVAIAGTGPKDVWAFHSSGSVRRFDGVEWKDTGLSDPYGVVAGAVLGKEAWALGGAGKVHHFDGTSWKSELHGSDKPMHGIAAVGPSEAIVAGEGKVLRRSGGAWTELPGFSGVGRAIHPTSGGGVDVLGDNGALFHWNGSSWSKDPASAGADLVAVHGAAKDDVWAVGAFGATMRFDGSKWTSLPYVTRETLNSAWTSPDGKTWIASSPNRIGAGPGKLFRDDGSGLSEIPLPSSVSWLSGVHGSGTSHVVAVGSAGTVLTWNGKDVSLTKPTTPYASSLTLRGVWTSGPNDVWIVGDRPGSFEPLGVVVHWNGTTWSESYRKSFGIVRAVWGSGPNDVYAAGVYRTLGSAHYAHSFVVRWNGSTWSNVPGVHSPTSIFGTGPNDVFVAGEGGIAHFDGIDWKVDGTLAAVTGLFGSSASDVFAVSSEGAIAHWNGTAWTAQKTPARVPLRCGAVNGKVVRAFGDGGAILRKK